MVIVKQDIGPNSYSIGVDGDTLKILSPCCCNHVYWKTRYVMYCSKCEQSFAAPKDLDGGAQLASMASITPKMTRQNNTEQWVAYWAEIPLDSVEVSITWES